MSDATSSGFGCVCTRATYEAVRLRILPALAPTAAAAAAATAAATTTAATATTTAAEATATTTAAAVLALFSFVHAERTTVEDGTVHLAIAF